MSARHFLRTVVSVRAIVATAMLAVCSSSLSAEPAVSPIDILSAQSGIDMPENSVVKKKIKKKWDYFEYRTPSCNGNSCTVTFEKLNKRYIRISHFSCYVITDSTALLKFLYLQGNSPLNVTFSVPTKAGTYSNLSYYNLNEETNVLVLPGQALTISTASINGDIVSMYCTVAGESFKYEGG